MARSLTGRQLVRIGRVYAQRYGSDPSLTRVGYAARLDEIAVELYGQVRFPGRVA